MVTVQDLHSHATELAELAFVSLHKAQSLNRKAFSLEFEAAKLLPCERASEPTRSILYLSAGYLAYRGKDRASAREMARLGLEGYPSAQLRDDFSRLLKTLDKEEA